MAREMHISSNQYLIALEKATNTSSGKNLGNWYPYFSQNMGGPLPSNFHHVECFIARKLRDSFNQFLIVWETAAKPIPWERTGK